MRVCVYIYTRTSLQIQGRPTCVLDLEGPVITLFCAAFFSAFKNISSEYVLYKIVSERIGFYFYVNLQGKVCISAAPAF